MTSVPPPACRRALVAATLLLALALTGCSRDLVQEPTSGGGSPVATSPEAARTKLSLELQDPCASGDARTNWPRCGRWVEETASAARSAADALPGDGAVTTAAGGVGAGRDAFVGRGCTAATSGGAAVDPGACIGALLLARRAVGDLAAALHIAP